MDKIGQFKKQITILGSRFRINEKKYNKNERNCKN